MLKKNNSSPSIFKINGSIIVDGSYSESEFEGKWDEFLSDNGLSFIGNIEKISNVISISKSNSDDLNTLWNKTIKVIEDELSEVSFNTWIKPIQPYSIEDNKINLVVKNNFTKGILDSRYSKLIKSAIKLITDKDYEIVTWVDSPLINTRE